jgi:hypothetical protein
MFPRLESIEHSLSVRTGTGREMEIEKGCDAQRAQCAHLQKRVNTLRAAAERLRADETDFFKGKEFERAAMAKALAAKATDAMDVAVVDATAAAVELQKLVNKIDQMQLPLRGDAGCGASASSTHHTCDVCRKSLESTYYSASQLKRSLGEMTKGKGKNKTKIPACLPKCKPCLEKRSSVEAHLRSVKKAMQISTSIEVEEDIPPSIIENAYRAHQKTTGIHNVEFRFTSPTCITFTGYSNQVDKFLEGFEDYVDVLVSKVPKDFVVILEGPMELNTPQEISHEVKRFMCDIRKEWWAKIEMRTAHVKRCTQPKHVTSQLMQKAGITPCASKEMTAVDLQRLKKYLEKEYDKKHTRCTLRVPISLCENDVKKVYELIEDIGFTLEKILEA